MNLTILRYGKEVYEPTKKNLEKVLQASLKNINDHEVADVFVKTPDVTLDVIGDFMKFQKDEICRSNLESLKKIINL